MEETKVEDLDEKELKAYLWETEQQIKFYQNQYNILFDELKKRIKSQEEKNEGNSKGKK